MSDKSNNAEMALRFIAQRGILSVFGLALLTLGVSPVPALGASGDSDTAALEEITVTAQKRAESAQDVPITMTVFTSGMIHDLEMKRADDIARMTPNLHFKTTSGDTVGLIFMRGVGDSIFQPSSVGGVGIYVDEVYLNSPVVNLFSLYDIDRIEVLKGPQNTLYGRNTTGGAVSFITRRPSMSEPTNGKVDLTYGRFNELDFEGAVGMPLGQRAALRLAGTYQSRDGIFDNQTLHRSESDRGRFAARGQLLLQPTDNFGMLLNLHGGRQRNDTRAVQSRGMLDPSTGNPCSGFVPIGACANSAGFRPSGNFADTYGNIIPQQDIDATGASITLDWTFPGFTIKSITAYERNKIKWEQDVDGTPAQSFDFHQVSEAKQISQEIRIASASADRLEWIAGLYYFKEDLDLVTASTFFDQSFGAAVFFDQRTKNWSPFADVSYKLTDRWKVTAGIRYTREEKQGGASSYLAFFLPPSLNDTAFIDRQAVLDNFTFIATQPFKKSWGEWGGRFGLDFRATDNALLYLLVSRGFKGGQANPSPVNAAFGTAGELADPEFLLSYELGAKTTWLNGRLQANAAVFYSDYTDQQVFRSLLGGRVAATQLVNAGKSSILGAEFELQWAAGAGWYVGGGLGLLDAKVDRFLDPESGKNYKGNQLVMAPRVSFNALLRKEWNVGDGKFSAQADTAYISKHYFTISNDLRESEKAYWTSNARASYRFGRDERYELAAWGKNIFDKQYIVDCYFISPDASGCGVGDPRTYGITASVKF